MAKKSTASDWDSALLSWRKDAATTKKNTKRTTSTSDRVRDTQLGKTQTVAQQPVSLSDRVRSGSSAPTTQGPQTKKEAERRRFTVEQPSKDPFAQALNRWRSEVVEPQQQRVMYDIPQQQFDYAIDRVDTRPGAFTAQQTQSPTATTQLQPYNPNTAQGPSERPTGLDAWIPKSLQWKERAQAAPVGAGLIVANPMLGDALGAAQDLGERFVGDVGNSAAAERFLNDARLRAENDAQTTAPTWEDWRNAMPTWEGGAPVRQAMADAWNAYQAGDIGAWEFIKRFAVTPAADGEAIQPLLTQYTAPTKWLERQSQNALSGLQAGQDYMMTGFDIPESTPVIGESVGGLPLGPINASMRYAGLNTLKNVMEMPTWELFPYWLNKIGEYAQTYRDATVPTAEQAARTDQATQAMNRERSYLNWADYESVEKTYDALTNQQQNADALYQEAQQAWLTGAQSTSEQVREESWRQAADAGYRAYQLKNAHPQQIVNENTNLFAQMLMEITTPDPTDLLGKFFEFAELTPAARRLTRVAGEVMTPAERAVAALDDMVVTAENTAQVAAARSTYKAQNLLSPDTWWTVGRARAGQSTDKMVRYTVNLLGDVETSRDAAVLLTTLATDPRKLITGIPAAAFQSPGLIARADEKGLVRFGSMGLQNIKEPLRIYQQAAQNILASPVFKEGATLNKVDFLTSFIDEMNQAGYRFYNVAQDVAQEVPAGTSTGRIIGTGNRNEYVVEFVGADKKVISQSQPMTMAQANKLKGAIGKEIKPQASVVNEIGKFQRSLVSPFYITLSPGTWLTNILGGTATAFGDGMLSARTTRYIDEWVGKQFGVDPTVRGFESVAAAASPASQFSERGPFRFLKKLSDVYGKIDETVGKNVFYSAANRAMRKLGKETLTTTLGPVLTGIGVDTKTANRMITHLYEAGLRGDDLTAEFNKLLNGQTRILNLSEVNPIWLDAIPPDRINELQTIIRTAASRDEALAKIKTWGQAVANHWNELIASSPTPPQRYVWQKVEVAQDTADIAQAGKMAQKYGELPAEAVQAQVKQLGAGLAETQQRMQTLAQIVTESGEPANRYLLYNVWGQVTDLTAGVRAQLNELAEAANGLTGPAHKQAWENYWTEAQRLWTERNAKVNQLMNEASAAMASGQDFTPRLDSWNLLERTSQIDEQAAWATMRLEPQSGRYDPRLKQVIEAGRAISDRAVARTYMAARRFLNVDAMDYIVSAEHSVQMAAGQVEDYLARAREAARKTNTDAAWDEFFQIRNEVRRQQRVYEVAVWENATYQIAADGIKAGEPVLDEAAQAAQDYYSMRKPAQAADELPQATQQKIDDYLAQAEKEAPYPAEAQAILDEATFNASVEQLAAADAPFPGSKALDEAEGLRAERAAAQVAGGQETRAQLRTEWDRVAKAEGGYLSIDRAVQSYTRDGVVSVPENKFEDLYGKTIAGQTINNQDDVNRLLQQYYDMGQQRLQRKAASAPTPPPQAAPPPLSAQTFAQGEDVTQAADETITPAMIAEYKALPRSTVRNMFEGDLRTLGYTDEQIARMSVNELVDNATGNVAPPVAQAVTQATVQPSQRAIAAAKRSNPETIAIVAEEIQRLAPVSTDYAGRANDAIVLGDLKPALEARGIAWEDAQKALIDMQIDGGVTLMRLDDPWTYRQYQAAGRWAELETAGDQRHLVYPKNAAEYIDDGMRTLDFSVPALDFEEVRRKLNLGGLWGKDMRKESEAITRRTTAAGGATAGDLAEGAAFAKLQLENILQYMENNIDEILRPPGRITQGQNLQALDAFRRQVLPAWDNVKYAASEYGNRMRSFTMVDFSNTTRLDEMLGLVMPFGFWMTRTAKNSLERAIFQPHIWRRVMQAERDMRAMQEQGDYPERYEGAMPFDMGNGTVQWLRLLPSKYWPAAGIFTSNDYADPESANSALGYAVDSMRAANLAMYPWIDAGVKAWEGETDEIYPVSYTPQSRILADLALKFGGADMATRWTIPGYFENSVARTLNNMAAKGEITKEQARWAHDYLWQLKNGGQPLPEEGGVYDPAVIEPILDKAMRATAGDDLQAALSSFFTGVSARPYDTTEEQWSGAAANYRNYKYGEQNPYGSKTAADTQKPLAQLSWSKSGIWRPEDGRPGISMATDAKAAEKESLNQELMAATDQFISTFNGTPENWQLNEFKNKWMADKVGGSAETFYADTMNGYLDKKYPSATTFEGNGGPRYPGYAPEEIRQKVRVAAYYQAKEELEAPVSPVYPGDNATKAQYNEYFTAKDKYDADKKAYETALVARVAEIINDPTAIRKLMGVDAIQGPQTYMESIMSQWRPTTMENVFGYPVRPTGEGDYQMGLVPLAGDPATAEAIIEQERTKYMSDLEKQVRAANAERDGGSGRRGRGGRTYSRRSSRRGSGGRRRSYGGGGGGGRIYNVPDVYGKGLSEWLMPDPERVGYQAPNQVRVNVPKIGPDAIKAWRPLSWR